MTEMQAGEEIEQGDEGQETAIESQAQTPMASVNEISGGRQGQVYIGGHYGQIVQTQMNKIYHRGEFQVGCFVTVHENCPISLPSRAFNATLHSNVSDDREAAIKITPAEKINYREAKIHFSVPHHENIVERIFTDTFNYRGLVLIFIAMERCDCNLHDHVKSEVKENVLFDPEKYIWIAFQILKGLNFLYSHGVIHGDLKPANVLLNLNGNIVKLSDFGLSKGLREGCEYTLLTSPQQGTVGWQSPEILDGTKQISMASDIFPCGLVIYYVFSHGKHAYGPNAVAWSFYISEGINRDLGGMLIPYVDEAKTLLEPMFEKDPSKRPTAKQVLQSKLFTLQGIPSKASKSIPHNFATNDAAGIGHTNRANKPVLEEPSADERGITRIGAVIRQLTDVMEHVYGIKKICLDDVKNITIPLGKTIEQLSEVMGLVSEVEKINLDGNVSKLKKVTPLNVAMNTVQEINYNNRVKKQTSSDEKSVILLGETIEQLSDVMEQVSEIQKINLDDEKSITPLGETIKQLSGVMDLLFEVKKISLDGQQPVKVDEKQLVEVFEQALRHMDSSETGEIQQCEDEATALGVTVGQFSNAMESFLERNWSRLSGMFCGSQRSASHATSNLVTGGSVVKNSRPPMQCSISPVDTPDLQKPKTDRPVQRSQKDGPPVLLRSQTFDMISQPRATLLEKTSQTPQSRRKKYSTGLQRQKPSSKGVMHTIYRSLGIHSTQQTVLNEGVPLCQGGCNVILMSRYEEDSQHLAKFASQLTSDKSFHGSQEFMHLTGDSNPKLVEERLSKMPVCKNGITTVIVAYHGTTKPLAKALKKHNLQKFLHSKRLASEEVENAIHNIRKNLAVFTFHDLTPISQNLAKVVVNIHLLEDEIEEPGHVRTTHKDGKPIHNVTFQGTWSGHCRPDMKDFVVNDNVTQFIRNILRTNTSQVQFCKEHGDCSK